MVPRGGGFADDGVISSWEQSILMFVFRNGHVLREHARSGYALRGGNRANRWVMAGLLTSYSGV